MKVYFADQNDARLDKDVRCNVSRLGTGTSSLLTDLEWSERLAVPINLIQAAGSPNAPAAMAALTGWRWESLKIDRDLWFRKMVTLRAPSLEVAKWGRRDSERAMFYDTLLHKCMSIYGGVSCTDADPLALARHPWTLTSEEFKDNYESLCNHKIPDAVVDERKSAGILYGLISAAPTAGGAALCLVSGPVGTAVIVGGAGIGAAGLGIDRSRDNARVRQLEQIRHNFAGYKTIYEKEAQFRAKLIDAEPSS